MAHFCRPLSLFLLTASVLVFGSCTEESDSKVTDSGPEAGNPYIEWRNTIELPEGSPDFDHASPSDCTAESGDAAILDCANNQFWRVFQRDTDSRKEFWDTMLALEGQLTENADPAAKARFLFQRAQVAMMYILEQSEISFENMASLTAEDFQLLGSMSADMSAAIALDPNEPFYVTWLDTVKIATADRLGQKDSVLEAVDDAWSNVQKWTENTTRSALIASLTGTTIGMSIDSGVPHRTLELIETFECHPKVLMENPDAMCGKGDDKRRCLDWCLANSAKAPYGGPGLIYHVGEIYARMGDAKEAQRMYELALTLPGADEWPYRTQVEEVVANIDGHLAKFSGLKDDETASYVVYANSKYGCSLCHGKQ